MVQWRFIEKSSAYHASERIWIFENIRNNLESRTHGIVGRQFESSWNFHLYSRSELLTLLDFINCHRNNKLSNCLKQLELSNEMTLLKNTNYAWLGWLVPVRMTSPILWAHFVIQVQVEQELPRFVRGERLISIHFTLTCVLQPTWPTQPGWYFNILVLARPIQQHTIATATECTLRCRFPVCTK